MSSVLDDTQSPAFPYPASIISSVTGSLMKETPVFHASDADGGLLAISAEGGPPRHSIGTSAE